MAVQDFRRQLKRQLQLLWSYCREFDSGDESKALPIAACLRVLFHSHGTSSTSALKHLDAESILLLSTAHANSPKTNLIFSEGGLTAFRGNGWIASLDRARNRRSLKFHDWWDTEAVSAYRTCYTRKSIVLDTCNKDGATHIDKKIPERLSLLIEGPWNITTKTSDGLITQQRKANLQFQYLRQIAYEVLHSDQLIHLVDPNFRLQKDDSEYLDHQRLGKAGRVARLKKLYATAVALLDSRNVDHAKQIIDVLTEEIGIPDASSNLTRLYCCVRLTEALAFPNLSAATQLLLLTKLRADIDTTISPRVASSEYIDIFLKTLLYIGFLHAKNGERRESEESWKRMRDISKNGLQPPDSEGGIATSGPLYYYLHAAANIAVHASNSGEYNIVISEIDTTFKYLNELYPVLIHGTSEEIESRCGMEYGDIISQLTCKALRSRAIAYFAVSKEAEATQQLDMLTSRFNTTTNSEILRMLNEAKRIFNKEIPVIPEK